MSVERKRPTAAPSDGLLADLTIKQHQVAAAADPARPMRSLIGSAEQPERFIGRPWFVWKDNLELAKMINDRLASRSAN